MIGWGRGGRPLRGKIAHILLLAFLLACTETASTETSRVDPFAPTPTIGDSSTTTTRLRPATPPDSDPLRLVRVDDLLQPVAGFEPISVGDLGSAIESADGSWVVMWVVDGVSVGEGRVVLIDAASWNVVGEWALASYGPVSVDEDGRVILLDTESPTPRLLELDPGDESSRPIADLPPRLGDVSEVRLSGSTAAMMGSLGPPGDTHAAMVWADIDGGEVRLVELAAVRIGVYRQVGPQSEMLSLTARPAWAWDEPNRRLIVAHAENASITEVDMVSGLVSTHPLDSDVLGTEGELTSTVRHAALSGDGTRLYLGTTTALYTQSGGGGWEETVESGRIVAVDTRTWETVATSDAPISAFAVDPAGRHVLGVGQTSRTTPTRTRVELGDLYVMDAETLQVLDRYPSPASHSWVWSVSVSRDGTLAYTVTGDRDSSLLRAFDLDGGTEVASVSGGSLQLLPAAGVLAVAD